MTNHQPQFSKAQVSFYRKLYLAFLIDSEQQSIPSLEAQTGMPRRTLQDCIKSMSDIDISCEFISRDGTRHNDGYYRIVDWGPINPNWIEQNKTRLEQALGLQA